MRLNISAEHRSILTDLEKKTGRGFVTSVPDNTPKRIVDYLTRRLADIAEERSTAPYSEVREQTFQDDLNRARLAELGQTCRFEPGQSADPTASLRDEDDEDFDPERVDNRAGHERAVSYHRNQAQCAKSLGRCTDCHKAADAHALAARTYPNASASAAARAWSRLLKG